MHFNFNYLYIFDIVAYIALVLSLPWMQIS